MLLIFCGELKRSIADNFGAAYSKQVVAGRSIIPSRHRWQNFRAGTELDVKIEKGVMMNRWGFRHSVRGGNLICFTVAYLTFVSSLEGARSL